MTTSAVLNCASLGQWQQLLDGSTVPNAEWKPRADVFEDEKGLSLQFDLPGIAQEGVEIHVEKNLLTLKGERKLASTPENYHRVERPYGSFARAFTLPEFVDQSAIEAKMANGVLSLFLPRREETKPKQIQIQVQAA